MFTIIKGQKKIQIPSNEVASLQSNYEGVIVTCTDRTELRFAIETNNAIQAILNIADKNLGRDITIDLNAAMRNKASDILKIGSAKINQ